MRVIFLLAFAILITACNNNGSSKTTTDSSSTNVNSGNVSDGGPNNRAGDTNDYSRMNDRIPKDSTPK